VFLACRDASKANAALAEIRKAHPDSQVRFASLDLFSLASVRRFPALLTKIALPPLGGLILNAGGINMKAKSLEFTEDGFERTCQLNFLGHFLLANLLVDQMGANARTIFVSSDLHDPAATRMGKIMSPKFGPVEDLARGTGTAARLKPMARYGTAKLYAMMTAYELDRRGQFLVARCCADHTGWQRHESTDEANHDEPPVCQLHGFAPVHRRGSRESALRTLEPSGVFGLKRQIFRWVQRDSVVRRIAE
jgi:NAD(P)-dependent dehydrogenase (short-subunit alcohol dehydrogenase family)